MSACSIPEKEYLSGQGNGKEQYIARTPAVLVKQQNQKEKDRGSYQRIAKKKHQKLKRPLQPPFERLAGHGCPGGHNSADGHADRIFEKA